MTESVNGFLKNLEKLHTTKLGEKRIRKNLSLPEDCDPVSFCQNIIKCPESEIYICLLYTSLDRIYDAYRS